MKKIWLAVAAGCCWVLGGAETVVEGRVIKYPLNVRAGAGTKYTAVAQLNKNNPVKITAVSDKWLAIQPPENSRVWVLERYLKNGRLTSNVNLRSGPSSGYEALGIGRRGMKVQRSGQATPGGWVQISPPENIVFYVGRPAVEADAAELQKLPRFKAPGGRALPNADLINLEGNFITPAREIQVTGYLYESEDNIKAITHVLYEVKGEDLIPKYFIMPNRQKLTAYNEKQVKIIGDAHKVKNWQLPVVVIKIITPVKE